MSLLEFFFQLTIAGLAVGSVYALVAMGFSIIFSVRGILNFAQGEFVMLGALIGYSFYVIFKWPLILSIFLAATASVVLSVLLDRLALNPLPKSHSNIGWIMSTLGVGIIIRNLGLQIWGTEPVPFPALFGNNPIRVMGAGFVPQEIITFLIALGLVVGLDLLQNNTIIGKAVKATAIDWDAAGLMGISTTWMLILTFATAGLLSALAGILIAPIVFASAERGLILGFKGFSAAALGGLGSSRGALVGGLTLGVLESLSAGLFWTGARDIVAFVILILILLIRPTGIFRQMGPQRV
jgi:branched-chain amino acid transport system permease protein